MCIDKEQLSHLADLARLELDRGETESMACQMEGILACMRALEEVCPHGQEARDEGDSVLREDICMDSAPLRDMLANAPRQDGRYIQVPRTVE
ncbi:MAG: Asp-tRNA(Asn)/Glu-tRNA(Gln) amidotransferase subunit GatC [Oscillospiraceae bacterium]|nr:Asp-tRNA(Asn)/Glu-tRNA(Gln) amidotransferase subunit GatC [Oscillospiraceae bacterium]